MADEIDTKRLLMFHGLYKMVVDKLLQDAGGELLLDLGPDAEPPNIYHRTWVTADGHRHVLLRRT